MTECGKHQSRQESKCVRHIDPGKKQVPANQKSNQSAPQQNARVMTQRLEHAALQCGICTPGMLVASDALLRKNPDPTEEEVRFWLAGNLCRCTGYDKIVRAVLDAAAEMRT